MDKTNGTVAPDDILSDPYLTQLLSYSLDTFSKEPESLKAQQKLLHEEQEETAVLHHQGFVNAATCFQEISGKVDEVHQQLHALAADMEGLHTQGVSFITQAKSSQEKRRVNRSLLGLHGTVMELLEVPQLIDTCVRNGNYDEALELMAFMNKVTLSNADVPVMQQLLLEVKACSTLLLEQLLTRLSGQMDLPECLRSVSYLRRLSAFSESELRHKFLQCRELWFQSVIDAIDDSNAADYVRQLTDSHRLHVFDIVMQYRAIFSESETTSSTASWSTPTSTAPQHSSQNPACILYSWVQYRIHLYTDTLEVHLPRIQDGNSLTEVMEACMYSGRSLSRVGLDVRGLFVPIFAKCSQSLFGEGITHAVSLFATSLSSHKWVSMPTNQSTSNDGGNGKSTGKGVPSASAEDQIAAAHALLEHAPLAVFVNAVITALNTVRGTAMLRVSGSACEVLQAAVRQVCAMLTHETSTKQITRSEAAVHVDACKAMIEIVCPLVLSMYTRVFSVVAVQPDFSDALIPLRALVSQPVDTLTRHGSGAHTRTASMGSVSKPAGTTGPSGKRSSYQHSRSKSHGTVLEEV